MKQAKNKNVNGKFIITFYILFIFLVGSIVAIKSFGRSSALTSTDIDAQIEKKWTENNLTPSETSTDEDFIRRIYIDLIGRTPETGEVTAFLDDKSADKRSKKIDELLSSEEFGRNMADIWMNLLFTQDNIQKFPPATYNFVKNYFARQFNKNKPYDKFVYNLISAEGLASTNPNVLYISRFTAPEDAAGTTMKIFMGKRIQCAQCHHHPYENITQDDFWGVAAFYAREKAVPLFKKDAVDKITKVLTRYSKLIKKARENAVDNDVDGKMIMDQETEDLPQHKDIKDNKKNPNKSEVKKKDNKNRPIPPEWVLDTLQQKLNRSASENTYVPDVLLFDAINGQMQYDAKGVKITSMPKYLGGASVSGNAGIERRELLAKELTTTESKQLAREFVNRFWKHFFGYGFVNPIDDFTEKGENSNPELLDALADEFVSSNFDVKNLFKLIVSTNAYQLSSTPNSTNKDDHDYFSRAILRPLTPVQLANSLMTASGYFNSNAFKDKDDDQAEKIKTRILKLFIFTFNDDEMGEAEDFSGTISQALLMMNSDLAEKVTEKKPGNTVADILNNYKDPSERIDLLYLNALSRYPSRTEKQDLLGKAGAGKEFYEDLEWALLNSSEFIFNH